MKNYLDLYFFLSKNRGKSKKIHSSENFNLLKFKQTDRVNVL